LAELIVSSGDESVLASHRRQVTVLFCDLRGFTAFAETADPEEVMGVLSEYPAALGALIHDFEGTIERFAEDGLMVSFSDSLPQPNHAARAVRMAVAMRDRVADLESDSMINVRPSQGNRSRGVEDPAVRQGLLDVMARLIVR
jgi:class 3 adenylate cyclase